LANGGRNISRSLKLLCLKRNIGNLSAIQEKSGYLLRQRGNERFVSKPEAIPGLDLFDCPRTGTQARARKAAPRNNFCHLGMSPPWDELKNCRKSAAIGSGEYRYASDWDVHGAAASFVGPIR
jgi:hypothetical protein